MRRPLSRTLALQGLQGAPGALARRARAMPSLDLRLAETKNLTDWISGQDLITFSRASSGTVVNAAGALETVASNLPRLTHNPLTGESLGLMVEGQRTNLLLRSEEFDNASWAKNQCSVTLNDHAAPNGTLTADRITATGNDAFVQQYPITGAALGATLTASIWVKGTGSAIGKTGFIAVATNSGIGTEAVFTVTANWQRVSVTRVTPVGDANGGVRVDWVNPSVIGDEVYLWGAQLEAGAFPTSYIPTTGATATRSADLADLISAAIANNIRAIYVEFRSPASGTRGVFSLNDNTANERSAILTSGTDSALLVHDNGIEQANIIGGSIAANDRVRVACRINQDSFAISVNGGIVRTDNTGTVPTVDRLMIGRTQAGDYLNASIARIVGWVEPLPDATLQAITR